MRSGSLLPTDLPLLPSRRQLSVSFAVSPQQVDSRKHLYYIMFRYLTK
jgi:hypothetical protein